MKKIALSLLIAAVVASCSAQIAVYNYSALVKGVSPGYEPKESDTGKMFYDFGTTNSITVVVHTSSKRVQMVRSMYQAAVTLTGKGQDTFTALTSLPTNSIPSGGFMYLSSPVLGKNEALKISSTQTVSFPKVFNRHLESLFYYPPDNSAFTQSDEVYTFSQPSTQTANANAQSIDDAAQAMVDALVAKGYQQL